MLVGRTLELDMLNSSFLQMLEGKGNVLFLTGEAGLGKTTLVHEWWKTIAPDSAIYAEAACSIPIGNVDVGRLEALQPWADIVAHLQKLEDDDSARPEKKLDLKKLIFDSAPAWAWALPIVGGIAHGAMETARLVKEQHSRNFTPADGSEDNINAQSQHQVFQQYANLLIKIADTMPLVILLDDMHWADTSSTNLLFYLSRQITEKKILLIVTYRPHDAIAANKGEGHPILQVKNEIVRYGGKEYSLTYLNDIAVRELLVHTFPDYVTNDKFERWLRKISDGNSLFVTQFIKTLAEDGHLNEHGAFIGKYEDVKTPESALAVVVERTRRLDDETRELLMYATAEGEEFTAYVLEQLSEKRTIDLLKELQYATQAGMIVQRGKVRMLANKTTTMYGFSHALFHKALYDSLIDDQKEYLHRKCFEILKAEWDRLSGTKERTNSLASKLLTHAEKCGEYEVAAEVALEAAKGAWQTYAEAEALEMLSHVQRLANDYETLFIPATRDAVLGDALLLRSKIDNLRGRVNDALKCAEEAYACFEKITDEVKCIDALNQQAWVLLRKGHSDRTEVLARNALLRAEKIGDATREGNALNCIGNVYVSRGENSTTLQYYTRNKELSESHGNRAGIATALCNIGNACSGLGRYDDGLADLTQALDIFTSLGDRNGIAMTLGNTGSLYIHPPRRIRQGDELFGSQSRNTRIHRESPGLRVDTF